MNRRTFLTALPSLLLAAPVRAQPTDSLLVFAAASLTEAMQDVAKLWEASGNPRIRFNFAASSTLARQLEQGAQANLFASADLAWMDWAQSRALIAADTRRTLLGNRLVLVAPTNSTATATVTIAPGLDLLSLLGPNGRLAIGDPSNVPAGLYARQALTKLGLWPALEPRLARAESVRSALLLVERGEAPLGIVYATDAAIARGVKIVATFPADLLDPPIAYPFAVTRAGDTPAARRFLAFLATPPALETFARRGFITE
jgi:molybdate transport system substrate-binding protein